MTKQLTKKLVIAGGIAIIAALFLFLDLDRYLTLNYIKESQATLERIYSNNSLPVIAVYMAIYIVVTALSLPGAAVLTLAGGALFGLGIGTLVVSFASTIGATLACLVARFLLRDWVQRKFADKLKTVNEGIEKEGAFYLFTLRLIPVFPFFIINLVMGLTRMPITTFYWISQIGMLPGTLVFVNAGKELGRIDSLAGILSPGLIMSFVLLGLFPITTKKIMEACRRKKLNVTV